MPRPNPSRRWLRISAVAGAIAALTLVGVLLVGGYFEDGAYALVPPPGRAAAPPLAAVYWSGDMGMRVGIGEGLVDDLAAAGVPVLTVSSPALFGSGRTRDFVDAAVERSVRTALERTHARSIAVIGNSFGADIVGTGVGNLPPELRRRIASVVLMVPSAEVYFHANPTGIFYRGPVAASPAHTVPLLRGLPVTCIYGTGEDDSLCAEPAMASARRVGIDDGHMMLWSHAPLGRALIDAVLHPPRPLS